MFFLWFLVTICMHNAGCKWKFGGWKNVLAYFVPKSIQYLDSPRGVNILHVNWHLHGLFQRILTYCSQKYAIFLLISARLLIGERLSTKILNQNAPSYACFLVMRNRLRLNVYINHSFHCANKQPKSTY